MQTKTQLPAFEGKPLIEVPKINFLVGEFGRLVDEEAKGRARADYGNAPALSISAYRDGVVQGSNSFYAVLVNQVVSKVGLHVATPADLERALRFTGLEFRGHYVDSGLGLKSNADPDSYLAKSLAKQLGRGRRKRPVMLPLRGLQLAKNSNSLYGLGFRLKKDGEVIYAPILNSPNQSRFSSKDIDEKTGLPARLAPQGDRVLWTRDSGLSGLYLYGGLDLYSDWNGLDDSDSGGRIAVVSD